MPRSTRTSGDADYGATLDHLCGKPIEEGSECHMGPVLSSDHAPHAVMATCKSCIRQLWVVNLRPLMQPTDTTSCHECAAMHGPLHPQLRAAPVHGQAREHAVTSAAEQTVSCQPAECRMAIKTCCTEWPAISTPFADAPGYELQTQVPPVCCMHSSMISMPHLQMNKPRLQSEFNL